MNDMSDQIQINIQRARQATVADSSKCRTCERAGIPIMPLRYAVLPKSAALDPNLPAFPSFSPAPHAKLAAPTLGQGVTDTALEKYNYGLRTLREGFLYVYLEAHDVWQTYAVTPQGYLTICRDHTKPTVAETQELILPCVNKAHDVAASFIHIPDIKSTPVIWLAFSQDAWTKKVLNSYRKPDLRKQRMTRLDLTAFKTAPTKQPHAFEIDPSLQSLHANVEEYAKTEQEGIERGGWMEERYEYGTTATHDKARKDHPVWSVHRFWSRHHRLGETKTIIENSKKKFQMPVAAVALMDTAGMIAELNLSRTKEVMRHQAWASSEDVAHKRLSSDAIKGVIEAIKGPIRADVNKRFGGKPQTKDARYHGAYVATVTVTPEQQVEHEAGPTLRRIQKHYNESLRAEFDKSYDKTVAEHAKKLAIIDADYAAWLNIETKPGRPNLDFLCQHDFDEDDHACGAGYIRLVGISVAGGPNQHSLAWFKKKLPLGIDDPKQILFRALVGNQKSFFPWVKEEKPDEAYDEIKALTDAGKLEKIKWLAPAVAIYAHPAIAAIGATAFILNKDLSVDKALRDRLAHLAKISIRLWEKLEVHTLKMRMSLGDYHQSLLRGAYADATAKTSTTPKEAGKATRRLPPKLKLPPALANKTAEIMFWTTGKLDDILARFPQAPASTAATDWVEAGNKGTQKFLSGRPDKYRRILGPGKARELGTTLIKRLDTVAGSKTGILAIGAMILQWQQLAENSKTITTAGGEEVMSAAFGLGDASLSVVSAGLEIASVIKEKVGFDKVGAKQLMQAAARFAAGAHLFNAIESFMKAGNRKTEGDADAQAFYFASGGAFSGAAISAGAVGFFGIKATFFGPLLGLGPVGWGFICLGAALTLYFAAVEAEDNAVEKWVARNRFWSTSERKEKRYTNWLDEAHALNAVSFGIKAELDWTGKWIPGMDTIKMRVEIPNYDSQFGGWRYRMIAVLNGIDTEIYNNHSNIARLPPLHPPRPAEMRPITGKHYADGRDFKLHDIKIEFTPEPNRKCVIEHDFDVDSNAFSQVRLEFDYFENVNDQSSLARIELTSDYKK